MNRTLLWRGNLTVVHVIAGICLVASAILAFYFGPKYGKKNMFVYITICSLIGGLSVSTLQGVGASVLTSIRGYVGFFRISRGGADRLAVIRDNQFKARSFGMCV